MRHKDNRDAIDFANEPVGRLFRQMLLPTLLGMVSIVILNFTDGAFIGHGAGADSLAAINIAAPIFNILSGLGIMFGIGCSVVSSIHLSKGNTKAASINVTQAIIGSSALAITASVVMLCNLDGTCRLFGSSEALLPLATGYLKWIAIGAPLMMLHMTGGFLIRLDGSPRFAMATSVVGTVLNIFLDWLFIFPLGKGLEGAAIATCISFCIAGLMVLWYFIYGSTIELYPLKCTRKSLQLTLRNLGYQVKMGFSAMLGEIAVCGAIIAGNFIFLKYLGEDGVAAYSVVCYCFPIIFLMANAIVESGQPIVSFAHGAGDERRLRDSRRLMFTWALGAGLVLGVVMFLCAPLVTAIFLDRSEKAFALSASGLPLFSIGILFTTLNVVAVGYLQSVEQSLKATALTLLRGFVLVIPAFIFLPKLFGTAGIWLSVPTAEALTTVVAIAISGRRACANEPKSHDARLLEACCTSSEEVRRAIEGGAGRIELCAQIEVGGVTPDNQTIREAVALGAEKNIPVNVLVRPRGGDFVFSADEESQMASAIERARSLGAAGVVIGALREDGSIDTDMMRRLIALAHGGTLESADAPARIEATQERPLSVTFHRAFDECREPFEALEQIISLGCERLLTSGQAASAYEGRELIARLVRAADDRIIIMPGAGITPSRLETIASETGAKEFHGTKICAQD